MRVITWSASEDAPTAHRWLARFLVGKVFLPVFITAKTEPEVIAKAQAFWDAETTKASGRKVAGRPAPKDTAQAIIDRVGQPDPALEDDFGDADAGLDEKGLIPGDKGARPHTLPETDDLDDLLG